MTELAKAKGFGWVECPHCHKDVDILHINIREPFCPYCGQENKMHKGPTDLELIDALGRALGSDTALHRLQTWEQLREALDTIVEAPYWTGYVPNPTLDRVLDIAQAALEAAKEE